MVEDIIGLLPRSGVPSGAAASTGGSSTRAGDGALTSSLASLLGGGVAAVPSFLVRAFASAPSRARSSVISSVVRVATGWAIGCFVVACPKVVCPMVLWSVGPEPSMVLGQHPRQRCKIPSKYKTLELRLYDKCTCFFPLLTGWSSCATPWRPSAWHGQPPPLLWPCLGTPARQRRGRWADLWWANHPLPRPHLGGCAACGPNSRPPLLRRRRPQLGGVSGVLVLGFSRPSLGQLMALEWLPLG